MKYSISLSLLALLLLACWGAGDSQAGVLFPPYGTVGAAKTCPTGKTFLRWTGDTVECGKVNDEVTVASCGSGQMLVGITNGAANCIPIPKPTLGPVQTFHFGDQGWSLLNCPNGYVMTGAGGWANTGTNIYMNCRKLQ